MITTLGYFFDTIFRVSTTDLNLMESLGRPFFISRFTRKSAICIPKLYHKTLSASFCENWRRAEKHKPPPKRGFVLTNIEVLDIPWVDIVAEGPFSTH